MDPASAAMARYAAGDDAAFEVLYASLAPRLYGYFFRRTRDRERTADLLQQTFLHVHAGRLGFLPEALVWPWVLAIARRVVIDSARRERRDRSLLGACDVRTAGGQQADELFAARQLASRLESEVARLPEPQRVAFELRQRGLSLSESAEVMRVSTGAIKLRIHRAHLALRTALLAE